MTLSAKLRRAPLRLVTGAYILNSGLAKRQGDAQTAQGLHGMASGAYPAFKDIEATKFLRLLSAGEIALGTALLTPIVSPALAGAGLSGFSGSLLGMWWRTPGMHEPNDPRPTPAGVPIAKDVWMFGIGLSLVIDALVTRKRPRGE